MVDVKELAVQVEAARAETTASLNKMFNNLQGSEDRLALDKHGLSYQHEIANTDGEILKLKLYMPKKKTPGLSKYFFSEDPVQKIGKGSVGVIFERKALVLDGENKEVPDSAWIQHIYLFPEKGDLRFLTYYEKGAEFHPFAEPYTHLNNEEQLGLLQRTKAFVDEYNSLVEAHQNQ